MLRVPLCILLFLLSFIGWAAQRSPLYQVDLILFTHPESTSFEKENPAYAPLIPPDIRHAISLEPKINPAMTPYHVLPSSLSTLKNDYWTLHHHPQYQVLCHYTWLQPNQSHTPIALSYTTNNGWMVEGTVTIEQHQYYSLETNLLFSRLNDDGTPFLLSQKERLKPGVVYYLDHPRAGLLINVHQLV